MSSFLSTAYSDTNIESQVNVPLAMKALSIRQGRYDENKSKIEQTLATYKNQIKGLRDSDNAYIASSLKQVESVINGYGNKDYSLTSTKDTLLGNLRNVTEDPIIRSAILNRAVKEKYDTDVAKIKAEGKGRYSDLNYSYGLAKGNVEAYMKGEAKDIGTLQYKDYVDDAKHFTDDLDKYVKEYATEHRYTSTGAPGDLIFRDEKHEVVDKNKIIQRMQANLSPNVRDQLEINGWGVARNNPKQNGIDFINFFNKQVSDTESDILTLKARKSTATQQENIQLDNDIDIKEKEILEFKKKAESGAPSDNDNTLMYTNNLFNRIANGYVKDDIVDSDLNDSNMQIAKYLSDENYKREDLILKKESNKLAKTANGIAGGLEVDAKDNRGAISSPNTEVERIAVQKKAELKNVLLANDPEFAKLPENKQWEYIEARLKNDKPIDITTDESSQKAQEAIRDFKDFNDQYTGNKRQAFSIISTGLDNQYNKLLGSKDIDNLEESNPHLYRALKAGKTIKQVETEMGSAERMVILHEMATNQLQTGSIGDEERRILTNFALNLERQKSIPESTKINMRLKTKDSVSWYNTGIGDLALGIAKGVGSAIGTGFITGVNAVMGRSNEENIQEYEKSSPMTDAFRKNAQNNYFNQDINPYYGNTNIGEIQDRNISPSKRDGKDMDVMLKGFTSDANRKYTDASAKLIPKIYDTRALAFTDKSEYATKIKTVLSAQDNEPVELEVGSAIKTSIIPGTSDVEITYTPKRDKPSDDPLPLIRKVVSIEFLPELAQRLRTEITPMSYSRKNMDAPNKRMVVSTPKETKDVYGFIRNLQSNYGEGLIPTTAINSIITDNSILSQAQFESVAENKPFEIANRIKEISSSLYGVEWANMGGVWTATVKTQDGKELIINTKKMTAVIDGDYNEGIARLIAAKLISDAKSTQISELIKQ